MKVAIAATLLVAAGVLAGCEEAAQAPREPGVCFAVEVQRDGETLKFNKVAENQPQIEFCAARLEEMRMRFLRLGGNRREITGAYQGQFIFVDRGGVSFSKTLTGPRFFALARTGDGRLAMPGAIQRQIDGAAPPAPAP